MFAIPPHQSAQQELDEATGNGTNAMQTQLESAKTLQDFLDLFETDNFQEQMKEAADVLNITWADAINNALTEYYKLREQVTGKTLVEEINAQIAAFPEAFVGLPVGAPAGNGVETPLPDLGTTYFSATQNSGKEITGKVDFVLRDNFGNIIQEEVIRLQERGNQIFVS